MGVQGATSEGSPQTPHPKEGCSSQAMEEL